LSVLYRTRAWLTLAQLLPTWARELAGADKNTDQFEHDLTNFLIEDIVNGRLDNAGPIREGRRLGLRLITPDNQAGYLEGLKHAICYCPRDRKSSLLHSCVFRTGSW
jgi:hypothetical protein